VHGSGFQPQTASTASVDQEPSTHTVKVTLTEKQMMLSKLATQWVVLQAELAPMKSHFKEIKKALRELFSTPSSQSQVALQMAGHYLEYWD
jgi:hypothetical protein